MGEQKVKVERATDEEANMTEKKILAPRKGYYFEEFEVGQVVNTVGRTITEADIVAFASFTGDWTTLHTDAEFAAQQPYGQRIAHGMLGLSVASALAVRLGILEETLLAFREIREWKFSQPIFIGDTVRVKLEISEVKPVARLGGGLVALEVELLNQRNQIVQHGTWTVIVKSREVPE